MKMGKSLTSFRYQRNVQHNTSTFHDSSHILCPDSALHLIGGDIGDNSVVQHCSRLLTSAELVRKRKDPVIDYQYLDSSANLPLSLCTTFCLANRSCHSLLDAFLSEYNVCNISRSC